MNLSVMAESRDIYAGTKYKSVGGWLLLFCLTLVAFNPLFTILNLVFGYNLTDFYSGILFITYRIMDLGVMIFSIYAGIALWKIRLNAVKIAKIYLLVFLGCSIFQSILLFVAGFSYTANKAVIVDAAKNVFQPLMYFALWTLYLSKSERVKGTYINSIKSVQDVILNSEIKDERYYNLQNRVDSILKRGLIFSILWLAGIGSLISLISGLKAKKIIQHSGGVLKGNGRVWWCLIVGAIGMLFWFPVIIANVF